MIEQAVDFVLSKISSMPANPLLAEAMYLRGTIERMGTGTEEMTKQCVAKGLGKPTFDPNWGFQTIIKREKSQLSDKYPTSTRQADVEIEIKEEVDGQIGGQTGGQTGGQILSEIHQKIIDIINENPKATRKEISKKLNINTSAVQKHINKLKKEDIICREGGDFGGYWKIIMENK